MVKSACIMSFKAHFAELALNAHARNYFNAFIVTVCMTLFTTNLRYISSKCGNAFNIIYVGIISDVYTGVLHMVFACYYIHYIFIPMHRLVLQLVTSNKYKRRLV